MTEFKLRETLTDDVYVEKLQTEGGEITIDRR